MKKQLFIFIILFFSSLPTFAFTDKVYKDLETFTKVMDLVDRYYVDKVDEKELILGAIKGLLFSLDPHTVYLSAEIYKNIQSDTKGRFGGVGLEIDIVDKMLTVVSPLPGTPAHHAGIQSDDKILMIDGEFTKRMTTVEAMEKMRGPIGRKVTLTIWRKGLKNAKTITLTREIIKVPSVTTEKLAESYGYFRVNTFQIGTAKSLKDAIEDFKKENQGELNGILIDLRDNPGGLLNEAVKMVDYFVDSGPIVSTKGRTKIEDIQHAKSSNTIERNVPMAVLINSYSASAAEIVAGALQDHGRAKLIGTKSFGKGSVQTIFELDNGDALKITIAKYLTPKNRLIDGKGIEPDIKVDQKMYRKFMKQLNKGKKSEKEIDPTAEGYKDYQRDEALKILQKMR